MMLEDFLQSLHGYFRTTGGEGGERGGGRGEREERGERDEENTFEVLYQFFGMSGSNPLVAAKLLNSFFLFSIEAVENISK